MFEMGSQLHNNNNPGHLNYTLCQMRVPNLLARTLMAVFIHYK